MRLHAPIVFLLITHIATAMAQDTTSDDPFRWLEDVRGDASLAWVRERNAKTAEALGTRELTALEPRILAYLDSDQKIPDVVKHGDRYYNFWRDAKNPRGLWRSTTLDEYRKPQPAWTTVLDLDALAAAENEPWVWHGAICRRPDHKRCLLSLSRGGSDASVIREFDLPAGSFVKDGFMLPEAKSDVGWIDADSIYVGTDFGPGSLTSSGYPRVVKVWKRGTPLAQAQTVYEGSASDVSVFAFHDPTPGFERDFVGRAPTFFTSEMFLRREGDLRKLDKPASAIAYVHRDLVLLRLREDWTIADRTYPAGALLAADFDAFMKGERKLEVLFSPTARTSLASVQPTRRFLLLNEIDNVSNRVAVLHRADGRWKRDLLQGMPQPATVTAWAIDADESDDYFVNVQGFLTPTTLMMGTAGDGVPQRVKQLPAAFDASKLRVAQHAAVSKDGTRVPYFEVSRSDLQLDGEQPTLLYGYGGFQVSLLPWYSGSVGIAWLERGGVYVVANIRGGGEFGPTWHRSALKENRPRAYEDFIAVAEDLIRRKVTSPAHLGIEGGSNGGLLVGNMLTMRPDLFGAVVCDVPLLDMRRYHKLLAGASWMAEYGDPDDPSQWAFIRTFSPYQNVRRDVKYPPTLFTTSTRDDRVHPAHARKMAAKMLAYGDDVLYYENIEGGHPAAADNRQQAYMSALRFTFLWQHLR